MAARVDAFLMGAALLALAATAGAADFGRLFTTPAERERLDRLRRGEAVAAPEATGPAEAAREPAITGFVKRSDGRHTIFIDGRPVATSDRRAGELHPREVRDDTTLPPSAVKSSRPR